jgi:hypothetical protein
MAKNIMVRKLKLSKLQVISVLCGDYSDIKKIVSSSHAAQRSEVTSTTLSTFRRVVYDAFYDK